MRVGFSLFTMTPALMTGTASYARGLIREFARPEMPVDPVVLVNRLMPEHVRGWSSEPVGDMRVGFDTGARHAEMAARTPCPGTDAAANGDSATTG